MEPETLNPKKDTILLDKDANILVNKDANISVNKDANTLVNKDSNTLVNKDATCLDSKDINHLDNKNTNHLNNDTNLLHNKDISPLDNKGTNVIDEKDANLQHQKDTNLQHQKDANHQNKGTEYRCDDSDSWSEDDDSSSTFSLSSSDSDTFFDNLHESSGPKRFPEVKTKGELDLDDLPPIEDLNISVAEEEIQKVGVVHAVVDKLVVIESIKESKPLDLDTVLFLSHDQPLGRVFDVYGPVIQPFYVVRFNSVSEITEKAVTKNMDVFYAPNKSDITTYVFLDELQNQKGSDASWKHNNEPPEEFIDYSDDEKEKAAKRKRVAKNRSRNVNNVDIAIKRPSLDGDTPDRPIHIHSPRLRVSHTTHYFQYRKPNPFSQQREPLFRYPHIPSLLPLRSPIPAPVPNTQIPPPSLNHPTLSLYSPRSQLQFHQQTALQGPGQSSLLLTPYPSTQLFGQIPTLGPVSPALHAPVSFHSSVFNNIPTFIPTQPPSPVATQNYFNQGIHQNRSTALQRPGSFHSPVLIPSQPPSPANVQNYFNQRGQHNGSPALQSPVSFHSPVFNNISSYIPAQSPSSATFNQRIQQNRSPIMPTSPLSPSPWLPNRAPLYVTGNLPPNAPLSVQIPPNFCPPHPVSLDRPQFPQPFENQRMNYPNVNHHPRFR